MIAEISALGGPLFAEETVEALLAPAGPGESLGAATRAVNAGLPALERELRGFVVQAIAERRVLRSLHQVVERHARTRPSAVRDAFANAYREVFESHLVALHDAELRGDELIDVIARHAPPGALVSIMGLQNIKGTGLDFVYRWVSIDTTVALLNQLFNAEGIVNERVLRRLAEHDDYGRFDSQMALDYLVSSQTATAGDPSELCHEVIAHLTAVARAKTAEATQKRGRSLLETLRGAVARTFDHLAAVRPGAARAAAHDGSSSMEGSRGEAPPLPCAISLKQKG